MQDSLKIYNTIIKETWTNYRNFVETQPNNPLHGKTLEMILTHLVDRYGWEELGKRITINCFREDPSIKSSLVFLRKTHWARKKVEDLYLQSVS